VTERTDGTYQVTANDMPLYYWYEDKQPGDVLGQGVGDVWWVLSPDGSPMHTAATSAEATAEATTEASAAGDTSAAGGSGGTGGSSDTSSAPQQMPVTGADGGTLGALIAAIGVLAGGGWVALRNRKR